jgi:DNA helicase-2/ATP-dependent DNA helicase PcrA
VIDLVKLNPPQRDAVVHGDGPLVVFAGAGSGKTRVITYRIARLVADLGVDPASILAVTFTNKAAGEMRERLGPLLGSASRRLVVGTFHSTSARIMREIAPELGLKKDFVIYDDQDQQAMLKRIIRDLDLDDREVPARAIAHRIDAAKNAMLGPDDIEGRDPTSVRVRQVFAEYELRMRGAHALDFGDLIYRLVLALEANPELKHRLSTRFKHLLVDEFQDTNQAQIRLVLALCSTHRNLCVVGDDDQSIYRWRGADRRNILDFRARFPDATIVKLEQNYRSSKRILRVAHEVIQRSRHREPKQLFTENDEGDPVLVVSTADERDEADMVVRGVRQLIADGVSLSEVAIFYRTNAQSRVFEEYIRSAQIPYRVVGGMRFYERAEVKDILAYLRVIINPADDVSCLRIVNVPTRGLGKTTIDRLSVVASSRRIPILAAMRAMLRDGELAKAAAPKIAAFLALIDGLTHDVEDGASIAVVARDVIEKSGYEAMLRADDSAEADARLENVAELVGSMAEFEVRVPDATLAAFLESVTLDTATEEAAGVERLTLMTVHAAKGLEFDVVMVTGLEEGMFPYGGFQSVAVDPEELDEERRLAYVAFTRARKRLVLSWAGVRRIFGQPRYGGESRFLREIAGEVHSIDTRPKQASSSGYRSAYGDARTGGSRGYAAPGGGYGVRNEHGSAARGARFFDDDDAVDARDSEVVTPRARPMPGNGSWVDTSDGDVGHSNALRVGARVRHAKFGTGVVRNVMPGVPPKVVVRFADGEKTVVATYLELGA